MRRMRTDVQEEVSVCWEKVKKVDMYVERSTNRLSEKESLVSSHEILINKKVPQ